MEQNNPSIWQRLRYRLGVFTRKELFLVAAESFKQGEVEGKNKALENLPKILADIAEERLKKLLNKDSDEKNLS